MVADIVRFIPAWMVAGLLIGALATVLVVLAFVLGDRLFPSRPRPAGGVDGSDRRRTEIGAFLDRIGERYVERYAIGDVTVDFYLPERDVAITFDAHDFFRLEDTGTFTVLVEDELPGRGLGTRLPFDVPQEDPGRPPSPVDQGDPVTASFAELGLARTADADTVKRAYRERVKQVHPDQGGDRAAFKRVQEAYSVARNHASGGRGASTRTVADERVSRKYPAAQRR